MKKVVVKYLMVFLLLTIYINRGVFVAMPGIELSNSSGNEINSLLEVIINWTGSHNDVDEDGDYPENYNASQTAQPLIAQNLMYINYLTHPYTTAKKILFPVVETMILSDYYGTIDKPPEQLIIVDC